MTSFVPVEITVDLVTELVRSQFPRWGALDIRPVRLGGWDNRTFRLGDRMLVRLPSAAAYADAVAKEQRWLPLLAPHLPLPIPAPLAAGVPAAGYPWPWSVYRWLPGEAAEVAGTGDPVQFAEDLAHFLNRLRDVDLPGPPPGRHNFFRGGPVRVYDDQVHHTLEVLGDGVDAVTATAVWQAALDSRHTGPDVWFHGDVAAGNLLVQDGRLSAVIDFGTSGLGDPACDLTVAWTLLDGAGREAFRAAVDADAGMWTRARGWAAWKALIVIDENRDDAAKVATTRRVLASVLAEHRAMA